jgi:ATP-dependent protease ClpP protease subunit
MNDIIDCLHGQSVDLKEREIYLHGYFGPFDDDPGVEYRMATTFIKNIRHLDSLKNEPILIHMHSLGGNWGDGMAIYDAIKIARSHTTIITYGQAESMSSVILQAADVRIMMPNSYFMCHYGSSSNAGNFLDTQNWAEFELKMLDTMLNIYVEKCMKGKFFKEKFEDLSESKVRSYIKRKLKDGDWYIDSNEAVYYGFADGVLSTRKYRGIASLK